MACFPATIYIHCMGCEKSEESLPNIANSVLLIRFLFCYQYSHLIPFVISEEICKFRTSVVDCRVKERRSIDQCSICISIYAIPWIMEHWYILFLESNYPGLLLITKHAELISEKMKIEDEWYIIQLKSSWSILFPFTFIFVFLPCWCLLRQSN